MLDLTLPFDDRYDDPDEEIKHLRILIAAQNERRRLLEIQAVRAGHACPPQIAMELKDIYTTLRALGERINQINAQLAASGANQSPQQNGVLPAILVLEEEPLLATLLVDMLPTVAQAFDVISSGDVLAAIVVTQQRLVSLVIAEHPYHAESTLEFGLSVQRLSPRTNVALVLRANDVSVVKHANAKGIDTLFQPVVQRDLIPVLNSALTPKR